MFGEVDTQACDEIAHDAATQRGLFGVIRLVSPLAARDARAVAHRATPRHSMVACAEERLTNVRQAEF